MKKLVIILLSLFYIGCSPSSTIDEELIHETYYLGYRTGQYETMKYYFDHKKLPTTKDISPETSYHKHFDSLGFAK